MGSCPGPAHCSLQLSHVKVEPVPLHCHSNGVRYPRTPQPVPRALVFAEPCRGFCWTCSLPVSG